MKTIIATDNFIARISRLVEENLENPDFKVDDLAYSLCVSRTILYRRMKDRTGLSPINFIKQKRIEKAIELLNDSNSTVTDVSYKTGFCSPQYLSRVFKKTIGCRPSEYKRKESVGLAV